MLVEKAKLANPEAITIREESRTKYEGLSSEQAAKLAGEAFPAVIDEPAGGPPKLPEGQHITAFPAGNVASVDLGEGKHGVVESLEPMAVEGSSGQRVPIDLSLSEAGGAFHPTTPLVSVTIPKQLGEGVQIPAVGVSLTPVNEQGSSLTGAEGVADGATVFYGSTQTDTDTVIKPVTLGFEADTVLRSVESPEQLLFRVGLPVGASLVQPGNGSGPVQVIDEGTVLAVVMSPSARDAAGTTVPVSMSVSGDTLALTVDHRAGEYQYPIEVDPTVTDSRDVEENSHWRTESYGANFVIGLYYEEGHPYEIRDKLLRGNHNANEFGAMFYTSQGESHIYEFVAETYAAMPSEVENQIGIRGKSGWEPERHKLPSSYGRTTEPSPMCPVSGCPSTGGSAENAAQYVQYANAAGSAEGYANLSSASVSLAQEKGTTAELNTTSPTTGYAHEPNILYTNGWIKPKSGAGIEVLAGDPGVGVYGWKFSSPTSPEWKGETVGGCGSGAICSPTAKAELNYGGLAAASYGESWHFFAPSMDEHSLHEGNQTVEITANDSMGLSSTVTAHIKIDGAPPHSLTVSGLPSVVAEREYPLSFSATDGSGSVESSGVASIKLAVDGHELGTIGGACSPGPCTVTAPWTLNGGEYGVGEHKLKITATDKAGNVATEEFTFHVHHAAPVALGPGAVNPQSGEFGMGATDVSVSAPGASLMVSRSYRSRHLTAGAAGPLGPQWSLSVGGQESITKFTNGNATLTASSGGQTTFTSSGGGKFSSPTGDANLTLTEGKNSKGELTEYVLKNAADDATTVFASTEGPTGSMWKPTRQEGPLASQAVRYTYQTVEGVTEPKYALAPEPAGVTSCMTRLEKKEELVKGCRALSFVYAEKTKESIGENQSQWGEYKGRLKEVKFIAYNPAVGSEKVEEKAVAEYSYDKLGRLRAEWNPQISPALETVYGYDAAGHVTALTPPGQESWAFTYGTIAGDTNAGRLLKVTRAPVSAKLWKGEAPEKTEVPKLSGTPAVGVRMAVSNGTWSNEPVAYSYQWEDCNSKGEACTPILGADNANYTDAETDVGHTLVALVTATNGGGSVTVPSVASGVVVVPEYEEKTAPTFSSSFGSYGTGSGQLREPEGGLATDASGNVWVSDTYNDRLEEFNAKGEFVRTVGSYGSGAGQFGWTFGVTVDSSGNVWATDEGNNRVEEFTGEGVFIKMFGWGVSNGEAKFETCTSSCHAGLQGSGSGEFYVPEGIVVDSKGNIFVADRGNHRVQEFNSSIAWVRNMSQPEEHEGPFYLGLDSSGNIWVAYSWDNKIGEFNSEGKLIRTWGTAGSEPGKLSDPYSVAVGPKGDIWVSEYGNNRVQVFTPAGEYLYGFGSKGNGPGQFNESPHGLAFSGADVYVLDSGIFWENTGNSRIEKWLLKTEHEEEGALLTPEPGTTIEYHVPVSGTGLPTMTNEEVEKWGQTDDPIEGMAIIAPDEPQGWPASKYTRASITYLDNQFRTVNTASPTGAISTAEYNENNDVVRVLSPDNRAAALKEGCKVVKTECKSAEVSKLLDTESTFNTTGSEPGTELLSVLGPQHNVELTNGTKAEARAHTLYSYNEGAPTEGGPYHLVTTMTEGAEIAGKEEPASVRTTKPPTAARKKTLAGSCASRPP